MSAVDTRRWQGIRDEVLRRISTRQWPPGAVIPGEAELAAEFGCARATVNRALRDLAEAGLLDRRRRAGTRVVTHPVRKATLDIPVIRVEIEALGKRYAHRLLRARRGPPTAKVRARLGVDATADMLHSVTLYFADGEPHAYEDRWINIAAVPSIIDADLTSISANEWLVAHAPLTRGDFLFYAENAGRKLAAQLGCAESAALLIRERSTWNGAEPITWVRLAHAPGYRMHSDLAGRGQTHSTP